MNIYELSKEIANWHAETFPNATEESQVLKLQEEFEELNEVIRKHHLEQEEAKEKADIFIVASSLMHRWNNSIGEIVFANFVTVKDEGDYLSLNELKKAVVDKMEVNRKRVWKKMPNGTYNH